MGTFSFRCARSITECPGRFSEQQTLPVKGSNTTDLQWQLAGRAQDKHLQGYRSCGKLCPTGLCQAGLMLGIVVGQHSAHSATWQLLGLQMVPQLCFPGDTD